VYYFISRRPLRGKHGAAVETGKPLFSLAGFCGSDGYGGHRVADEWKAEIQIIARPKDISENRDRGVASIWCESKFLIGSF
jgi:hypothetical protein